MWSDWQLILCDCGFQPVFSLVEKEKRPLKFPDGRMWLRETLGLVLMPDHISKSFKCLMCRPTLTSLLFTWGLKLYLEVMKIMATSFKDPMHPQLHSHPQPWSRSPPIQASARTPGNLWASLIDLCGSSFLLGLVHKVLFALSRVCFPVLCKFWQLYGGSTSLRYQTFCFSLCAGSLGHRPAQGLFWALEHLRPEMVSV